MEEFQQRVAARYSSRFGKLDPLRLLAKLLEESGELARAMLRDDRENAIEELGDCVIVLASVARYLGVDLQEAAEAKLLVHEHRLQQWLDKGGKV